jgi:hypothetical protein
MGQGQELSSAQPGDQSGTSKVKNGLKSLGTCDATPTVVQKPDEDEGDKPSLFHRTMTGATSFAKKTRNDVVCGAKDAPKAAIAIKQDGVNRQTVGRMAGDLLKTSEVMPHHLVLNAAGAVVKSETGIDLTPGGLKMKVAGVALGAVLDHTNRFPNSSSFETARNADIVQTTAMSAINMMRGRTGLAATVSNVARASGSSEISTNASITNSVRFPGSLGGEAVVRFGSLARALQPHVQLGAAGVGVEVGTAIGPGAGSTVEIGAGLGPRLGPRLEPPLEPRLEPRLGVGVGPVSVEVATLPIYSRPVGASLAIRQAAAPWPRESSLPLAGTQPVIVTPDNIVAAQSREIPNALPAQIETVSGRRAIQSTRSVGVQTSFVPDQTITAGQQGSFAPTSLQTGRIDAVHAKDSSLVGAKAPIMDNDSQVPKADDLVQRAIQAMRAAHRAEAIAGRDPQSVVQPKGDLAADPAALARAKQVDEDFAAAALKARAAIIAARSTALQ